MFHFTVPLTVVVQLLRQRCLKFPRSSSLVSSCCSPYPFLKQDIRDYHNDALTALGHTIKYISYLNMSSLCATCANGLANVVSCVMISPLVAITYVISLIDDHLMAKKIKQEQEEHKIRAVTYGTEHRFGG